MRQGEHVHPLVLIQPQRQRNPFENMRRCVDPPTLFKPGVPGDAYPRDLGELLSSKTRRPAPPGWFKTNGGWRKPFSSTAQESRQLGAFGRFLLSRHAASPLLWILG